MIQSLFNKLVQCIPLWCQAGHGVAEEGDLRLAGQVEINGFVTGALQVFIGGAFGAVCFTTFDSTDADVACRQMGFVGGAYVPPPFSASNILKFDEV